MEGRCLGKASSSLWECSLTSFEESRQWINLYVLKGNGYLYDQWNIKIPCLEKGTNLCKSL